MEPDLGIDDEVVEPDMGPEENELGNILRLSLVCLKTHFKVKFYEIIKQYKFQFFY